MEIFNYEGWEGRGGGEGGFVFNYPSIKKQINCLVFGVLEPNWDIKLIF